jgi:hypothetical protein
MDESGGLAMRLIGSLFATSIPAVARAPSATQIGTRYARDMFTGYHTVPATTRVY